jgi:thiamine kinase-like enzyme
MSTIYTKEVLQEYLREIFPKEDLQSVAPVRIGGMSNFNYKVDISGSSYVLRIPGHGSAGMVERNYELYNSALAYELGINPKVLYFDAYTGIKLTEYIDNVVTFNGKSIQKEDNLERAAGILLKLHNSEKTFANRFDLFHEIDKYECLVKDVGAKMYDGWNSFRNNLKIIEHILSLDETQLRPCHNDLVPENFIQTQSGSLYLIDWEYSGMNDPVADIAALFLECEFSEPNKQKFLESYYEGSVPSDIIKRILCYQVLWDCLWSQWTVIKEAEGDDFGTYGIDRYKRALACFKILDGYVR